jgi:hypothetical protein
MKIYPENKKKMRKNRPVLYPPRVIPEFPDGFHMEWVHGIIIPHLFHAIFRVESIWNE